MSFSDGYKLTVPPLEEKGPHRRAAQLTVDLCDHPATPNVLSDAILETLIEMGNEYNVNIWEIDGGLSADLLARLYKLHETGAGFHRARKYSAYEFGRQLNKGNGKK